MEYKKQLYILMKQADIINEEILTIPPTRCTEKSIGFMWTAKMEVTTKQGLYFIFEFWHHFHDDNGGSWSPSQKELDAVWRPTWVPRENSSKSRGCDPHWHLFYVENHVYISKTGFFGSKGRSKKEIITAINDSTWINDDDIWRLL